MPNPSGSIEARYYISTDPNKTPKKMDISSDLQLLNLLHFLSEIKSVGTLQLALHKVVLSTETALQYLNGEKVVLEETAVNESEKSEKIKKERFKSELYESLMCGNIFSHKEFLELLSNYGLDDVFEYELTGNLHACEIKEFVSGNLEKNQTVIINGIRVARIKVDGELFLAWYGDLEFRSEIVDRLDYDNEEHKKFETDELFETEKDVVRLLRNGKVLLHVNEGLFEALEVVSEEEFSSGDFGGDKTKTHGNVTVVKLQIEDNIYLINFPWTARERRRVIRGIRSAEIF